jgi:hypothetical protein
MEILLNIWEDAYMVEFMNQIQSYQILMVSGKMYLKLLKDLSLARRGGAEE